jgi:hypothetical protein
MMLHKDYDGNGSVAKQNKGIERERLVVSLKRLGAKTK